MDAPGWYKRQRARDDECRARSEGLLGSEKELFSEFMGLTASCLDAVFANGKFDDLVSRRKIEFGSHAFSLLCTAWDAALCGRYDAAHGHFRATAECCEFLMALIADPSIAERLGDRSKDIHLARRVVRDRLERGRLGAGRSYLASMQESAKGVQSFSHVCHEATAGVLAVTRTGGETVGVLRPGGAVSRFNLRLVAIQLSTRAAWLFGVLSGGFIDAMGLDDALWRGAIARANEIAKGLGPDIETLALDVGAPLTTIYFARSDEDLPS
jgi:hypothetical protein